MQIGIQVFMPRLIYSIIKHFVNHWIPFFNGMVSNLNLRLCFVPFPASGEREKRNRGLLVAQIKSPGVTSCYGIPPGVFYLFTIWYFFYFLFRISCLVLRVFPYHPI
jgi:hypothetical protein